MSKIAEYKALEARLAEQLAQLDALKSNSRLEREIQFEERLRALLAEYGMSLRNVIAILDPQVKPSVQGAKAPARKARQVKRYKNPHTSEIIETKGGNHRILKEWNAKYGKDVVNSWLQ